MCECGKSKVSRRDVLKGVGVGAVALAAQAWRQAPATAQTESPLPTAPAGDVSGEAVKLPPIPDLPDEADIVRYVELPDANQVNGYAPESVEATPERKAELEARDRYLATLGQNEQGDINRIGEGE